MNFITILYRLGIDPDIFVNADNDPVKTADSFIYEVKQKSDSRICIHCGSCNTIIHDHDYIEINCSETDQIRDILRIRKVRFKCKKCGKTFTPPIKGIESYSKTSFQTIQMIINDFTKSLTFSQIAERYSMSVSRIIKLFDEKVRYVPRRPFPAILCIDEIRFAEEYNHNYCCVLYDFRNREIVDIIRNRQMPYLKEYFEAVPEQERAKVRYFISDMYDGYATVCRRYFKNATHIIDLFHVITQLTGAVNRIRTKVMKSVEKGSVQYNFMKSHWKQFLCRSRDISDKYYTPLNSFRSYHYDELVESCVKLNSDFLTAYNILQDLYRYDQKANFDEAKEFVIFIANRLIDSGNEHLVSVGRTYMKWKAGIANGLAKSQNHTKLTNAVAESLNNQLKTIIKSAYGYHNFERFRKRALMIITYGKPIN